VYRKYTIDEHFFDAIDTESKAYWLGFVSADGNIYNGELALCLAVRDREHIQKFLNDIGSSAPVTEYVITVQGKRYRQARAYVCSRAITAALNNLGVTANKSLTISPCISVPKNLERHYWRGVFDGDGALYPVNQGNAYRASLVGTESMTRGFREFADQHTHLRPCVSPVKDARAFRVQYGGVYGVQLLVHALYDDAAVYLQRKKEVAETFLSVIPLLVRTKPCKPYPKSVLCSA
jgi:hypothetical protein